MIRFLRSSALVTGLFFLLGTGCLFGQSGNRNWQLSAGGGYMTYFGDLSPYQIRSGSDWDKIFRFFQYNKNYVFEPGWGLSLEKRFTPGVGFLIQANTGEISMSDRYQKNNGKYDINAPNWNRALNFKTNLWDAGIAFTFHADNGAVLKNNAFLSPYLFLGAGVTHFKVKGDLYDENGMPYNYSDLAVQTDRKFETDLRPLKTERSSVYPDFVGYTDLGLGLKFRLSEGVSLRLQTDIKYSFSDYLDDVSGKYKTNYTSPEQAYASHPGMNMSIKRGNDDGVNDFYIFNQLALQFKMGHRNRTSFKAPVIYNPGLGNFERLREGQDLDTLNKGEIQSEDSVTKNSGLTGLFNAGIKRTDQDSLVSVLREIRDELKGQRFLRLDQYYLKGEKEISNKIAILRLQKKEHTSSVAPQDSARLSSLNDQIDSLQKEFLMIENARQALHEEMPGFVALWSMDTILALPGGDSRYTTFWGLPEIQRYIGDSLSLMLNAHKIPDSSREKYLESEILRLQAQLNEQAFLDSADLGSVATDSISNPKGRSTDSLKLIHPEQSLTTTRAAQGEKEKALRDSLAVQRSELKVMLLQNSRKWRQDSLNAMQLRRQIDSLQKVKDSVNELLFEPESQKSIFKRLFNKRDTTTGEDQDLLFQEIKAKQDEIDKKSDEVETLNAEISRLRDNHQNYNDRMLDLERSFAREDRRNRRLELQQNRDSRNQIIAPVVPVITNNKKQAEPDSVGERLALIERKLDTLNRKKVVRDSLTGGGDTMSVTNQDMILTRLPVPDNDGTREDVRDDSLLQIMRMEVAQLRSELSELTLEEKGVVSGEKKPSEQGRKDTYYTPVSIYFGIGSSRIAKLEQEKLNSILSALKENPDLTVSLTGHTDATGSIAVNQKVANERIKAVRNLLVSGGIPASRISINPGMVIGAGAGSNALDRKVEVKPITENR